VEQQVRASSFGTLVEVVARTDVGRVREHNEDNFAVVRLEDGCRVLDELRHHRVGRRGTLLVVCDGMGGAAAGEIAAAMAIECVTDLLVATLTEGEADLQARARELRSAIERAGVRIYEASRQTPAHEGMGTTLTAALLLPTHAIIAQVGDSRAYVCRQGRTVQVTRDQSLVNQLLDAGLLQPEQVNDFEHSNVIVQALGVRRYVDVQLSKVALRPGDRLLVCSDGLVNECSDERIGELLASANGIDVISTALIDAANDAGGQDNTTVIVTEIQEGANEGDSPSLRYERWYLDGDTDPFEITPTVSPALPDLDGSAVERLMDDDRASSPARYIDRLQVVLLVIALLFAAAMAVRGWDCRP
jgi:serine/threonine protein phosphatase PrpC